MYRIENTMYKDVDALLIENDELTLTLLPQWGSKAASIMYKPLDYELLWQSPWERYRKTGYADPYENGEISGFDEMFPTISRCFYVGEPWDGSEMPDHGEVWSIPWEHSIRENSVILRVHGVHFPYLLEKKVFLQGRQVHMQYRVKNLSAFNFDCLWAAHPLFNASPGMKLIVPKGMDKIVNSVPGPRLGSYGKLYDFPNARLEDGSIFDLSRVPEKNELGYQKYFFCGRVPEGWCVLFEKNRSLNIGMAYSGNEVPYLGIWVNEGGWEGQYNLAPEPATGCMDRVDFSKMWGMGSMLGPGEERSWLLIITVHEGQEARSMTETGEFVF